jgi:hypothetical protein
VKVHCRVSKVRVPKLKVNGCGFSDVNRGQTVEVQLSKSVISLTGSQGGGFRKTKSKCEGSEDRSRHNGCTLS